MNIIPGVQCAQMYPAGFWILPAYLEGSVPVHHTPRLTQQGPQKFPDLINKLNLIMSREGGGNATKLHGYPKLYSLAQNENSKSV